MCGFIGITSKTLEQNKFNINNIKDVLNHRGPDNGAQFSNGNILFVHNRLSIIDLSKEADQPMVDYETGNVLIFNGEIYNYKELKKIYKNITWMTNSDSEVILKLYNYLGKRFVEKINGIFSFVIYDKKQNKVLLYRDRFGIKPLYYLKTSDGLIFSSEIKGIMRFKDLKPNLTTIYNYLEYSMLVYDKETFFEDVYSVEAAQFLEYEIDTRKHKIFRYWDVADKSDYFSKCSEEEITEKTHDLLDQSIKLNLVSDVEVALSLSSGTDSMLLLKLLEKYKRKIIAFTHGYEEKEYDEIRRIKNVINLSHIDFYPVYLHKKNMFKFLKEAIYYFETPIGGIGTLSIYNMMKEVRRNNIKVVLTGEGADEVFGGYKYYYPAFFKDIEKNKAALKNELFAYCANYDCAIRPFTDKYKKLLESIDTHLVLAPDATGAVITHSSKFLKEKIKKRPVLEKKQFASILRQVMYKDLTIKKLPKLLHFQDRSSMANGVESRVPFLDHNLVNYIYSLPPMYIIKNGQNKYLLRKILKEKYNFVENYSTKHYVSAPQREWLKDINIKEEILQTIKNGKLVQYDFINYKQFESDYIEYAKSKELGNSFFAWKIINLEYLLRQKWRKCISQQSGKENTAIRERIKAAI